MNRLAIQKPGPKRSSVTPSITLNEVLACVGANEDATWEDMKNGLVESYGDSCEVLQGVVNGAWIPKSEGKKDDGSKY